MIRREGDPGFSRISWDDAFNFITKAIRGTPSHRMGFFATSRGLTNEVYYVFQKLARVLGTNNVDLCSRLCHAASVSGLKATLGIGAPTCSLSDFIGTQLLVIFGSDLANNQPVTTKYMHYAKKHGTRIAVVNPMREYGLERYWVPSVASSALFGTKLMDEFFQVRVGGDIAFINGVIKTLIALNRVDQEFIAKRTTGYENLKAALAAQSWEMLEERSGLSRQEMERFALLYGHARSAVFVYSTGLTQHEFGVDNVKAIVNLALSRGMLGRDKCGIMPIRGHSGVQGGGECGAEPDKFPGGFPVNEESARRFSNLWRHPVPSRPGPQGAGDDRGGEQRRTQFSLFHRRQFAGNHAGPQLHRQSAGKSRRTSASGYRSQHLHAARRRASGAHPARADPLRAAQRRHVDQHRKTNSLHSGDSRDIRLASRCRNGRYPPLSAASHAQR